MKGRFFAAVIFLVLALVAFPAVSNAVVIRVAFNAWTTNYPDVNDQQMNFWVEAWDSVKKNPPDFLASIQITAPDGTVLNIDPVHDWLPFDKGYFGQLFAGDYDVTPFIAGEYKCLVYDKAGKKIEKIDTVNGSFIDPPVVTSVADQDVDVSLTHKIQWDRVLGAKYYRILLYNKTWNGGDGEPVFWYWYRRAFTDRLYFDIPKGYLKYETDYRLRIEARTGDQDLDKRSRCAWINFTTEMAPPP